MAGKGEGQSAPSFSLILSDRQGKSESSYNEGERSRRIHRDKAAENALQQLNIEKRTG